MEQKSRIIDTALRSALQQHGAVLIAGVKGCGKRTSALSLAQSSVDFSDKEHRDNYLSVAETQPSRLLIGDLPRAFLDWDQACDLWDAVRFDIQRSGTLGKFILTGSEPWEADFGYGAAQRILPLNMYPMSLYESGESSGEISLMDLFDGKDYIRTESSLSMDDLILAICRGGWPEIVCSETPAGSVDEILSYARGILDRICRTDISAVSKVKRKPDWAEKLLISYSKHLCTGDEIKAVYEDLRSLTGMTKPTFYEYFYNMQELYIIDEIPSWCPPIRAKGAVRAGNKRNLVDPSIAVAALALRPEYFNIDFITLGYLFQCLCARDLKVYSQSMNGQLSYYQDRYGLGVDGVLHLRDGRYALFDFKLGGSRELDAAAADLCKVEQLIEQHNARNGQFKMRLPEKKIILTAGQTGYRRPDGVYVLPIGCLKD